MANELTTPRLAWPAAFASARVMVSSRPRVAWRTLFHALLVAISTLYAVATVTRIYVRKYYVFLPGYLQWSLTPAPAVNDRPMHVFFLFTDHFEPDRSAARVIRWAARYRALASRHRDSSGRVPQHTFFYPAEQDEPAVLDALRDMTAAGLGEVELHFHHDYDTVRMLREKLGASIQSLQRYGFLRTTGGQTRFAFIHGNWGLDSSLGPVMCGVNAELRLLRELGCFADYTFPSVYEHSQPPSVNNIYAAKDDDSPKSYRQVFPLSTIRDGSADLVIFQGPLVFAPSLNVSRLFLDLDDGNIHPPKPGSAARVDRWMRANVHVPERPDWVFIKVFGHGISTTDDEEVVLGPTFDATLSALEQRYNDGRRYVLHYVTAREAYNLARAAADGVTGDPLQYMNYVVPPYVAAMRAGTAAIERD